MPVFSEDEGKPSGVSNVPRPIILDSFLRTPLDSKLLANYKAGTGRRPWVVCSRSAAATSIIEKKRVLEAAGFRVFDVDEVDG